MKKKLFLSTLLAASLAIPVVNFAATSHHHAKTKTSVVAPAKIVNINQADAKTLATLKDIGQKKAEAIVAYRKQHGGFKSLQDLTQVKGLSQRILKDNDGRLSLK